MPDAVQINLWELMTSVTGSKGVLENHPDHPKQQQAQAIIDKVSTTPGFATEISLAIADLGTWEVRLHHHEDDVDNEITLRVTPDGSVSVKRVSNCGRVYDERTVRF